MGDAGGSRTNDEIVDRVEELCWGGKENMCTIPKQNYECYDCIADGVRDNWHDVDYDDRHDKIEEDCYKGSDPPCSQANMKSSWALTPLIVLLVLKIIDIM